MPDVSPHEWCFNLASLGDELCHIYPECMSFMEEETMTDLHKLHQPDTSTHHGNISSLLSRLPSRIKRQHGNLTVACNLYQVQNRQKPTGCCSCKEDKASPPAASTVFVRVIEAETHIFSSQFCFKNFSFTTPWRASRASRLLFQPVGGASESNVRCTGRSAATVGRSAGGAQQKSSHSVLGGIGIWYRFWIFFFIN